MDEVAKKLVGIVLEIAPQAVVDDEKSFDLRFREIGVDSLESMNVLLAVQEQFGVEIPDADFDNLHTLNQVLEFIRSRKG